MNKPIEEPAGLCTYLKQYILFPIKIPIVGFHVGTVVVLTIQQI